MKLNRKKNRVIKASQYNLGHLENILNDMVGEPNSARRAMDYLTQRGFDNTELNGQDGYRKTSGVNQYDTWAGFEDEDGHYVKLTYTMVRDRARGGNAFKAGKLRGVYCEGYENDIQSSRRIRKRPIKASSSTIRTDFQKFVGDLEADLQDNERALSDCAGLNGSFMSDGDGAIFDITPTCYGVLADDLDTLRIEYDKRTGRYTAYCAGNDDIVAEGYSFNDISFDCYIWLKETLIQMYEELDADDDEYDY